MLQLFSIESITKYELEWIKVGCDVVFARLRPQHGQSNIYSPLDWLTPPQSEKISRTNLAQT